MATQKQTSRVPEALIHRLNRIEGQIEGLRAALLSGQHDCSKDMLQIKATHAAMKAFAKAYMDVYAKNCAENERMTPRMTRHLDTIIQSAFML
jgi:DNA-binding FrmR family transcriptional regulator